MEVQKIKKYVILRNIAVQTYCTSLQWAFAVQFILPRKYICVNSIFNWLHGDEHFWEAASCVATHEFMNILCIPKVHYRVHQSPPLVPILSQINSVHTTASYLYLSNIYFNFIHPPMS
jgi:hypothetical protein